MFEVCEGKCRLSPEKERISKLMMSFNEPMVAPSHHHVQPTHAYICTYKEDEGAYVYVYLYLTVEKTGVLYRNENSLSGPEEQASAEEEAVQFSEQMGFLTDDLGFEGLTLSQQEKLLETIPLFSPAVQEEGVKAAEEKVEKVEEIAEIEEPEVAVAVGEKVPEKIEETKTVEKAEEVAEAVGIETLEAVEGNAPEKVEAKEAPPEEVTTKEEEWEPGIFLTKFRIRAAEERAKRRTA